MKKIYILLSFCLIHFITQAQTIPAYVPTNGLVGWWPLDGNGNDLSSNGNNLQVNGNLNFVGNRNNIPSNACYFNNGNDFYSFPPSASILINNLANGTVSFWVKINTQYISGHYFGIGNSFMMKQTWGVGEDLFFGMQDGTTKIRMQITGVFPASPGTSIVGSTSLLLNNWYHVVGVWDGSSHKLYLNGLLDGQISNSSGISNMPSPSYFCLGTGIVGGNSSVNPSGAYGSLDDIAIYNRALTPQEITALYTSTLPCSLSISSQPTNQSSTTGSNASFNVGVTTDCNTPTTYHWQTNTGFGWQTLQHAGQYTGVNTSTLHVSNVGSTNTNQLFRCLIQSGNTTDTTQTATLSVVNTGNTNLSAVTHAIPYQAVVRDGAGNPLINHPLSVRCTLHDNTASGTSIYQETHTITTNNLGLFTLHIGTGVASIGNIDSIHWALYKKYLQVEFDTTAQGVSYIDLGTQQLMAVPYALYAETAGNALNAPKGDNGVDGVNGSNGVNGADGTNGVNGVDGISVTSANITNDSLYLSLSNSQILNAGKLSGGLPNGTTAGEMMYWNGAAWVSVAAGLEGQSLSFHNGTPTWENRLSVGMEYQGGVIAYILKPGDIGYDPNVVHGLIAAPNDQSTGIQWYNGSYLTTGATATALGTGNANTNTIVSVQGAGSYAAKLCYDLVLNGYSDWYLPSTDELNKLYLNRTAIGGFAADYYWSSSEGTSTGAWVQYFGSGYQDFDYAKANASYVRAVRAF